MNKKYSLGLLDFHTHSTHSDGSLTPTELVREAKLKGISAMALTDHNTISGLEEFVDACKKEDIFPIPFGVEIYAQLPKQLVTDTDNQCPDLVILGRNVNPKPFEAYKNNLLRYFRERFFPESISRLRGLGFYFPEEEIIAQQEILKTELQSPPKILHDFLGYPGNLEVFLKYLSDLGVRDNIVGKEISYMNKYLFAVGRPVHVERIAGFNVSDAIKLSQEMNAKLFIAHPGGRVFGALRQEIIDYYINSGVEGIEVRNYFNNQEQNQRFDRLSIERRLLRSGGSDYHGKNGVSKLGMYDTPENRVSKEIFEELIENLPN